MIIIYIILTLSILLNLVVFRYDILPVFSPILKRKLPKKKIKNRKRDNKELESLICNAALNIAKNNESLMIWEEPKNIGERIFNIVFAREKKNITYFNFPRAFLYFGVVSYLLKKEEGQLNDFKVHFDKIMNNKGEPIFKLEKVDQVVFGLSSLKLYEYYKEDKYLSFANNIYEFVKNVYETNDGIIQYRNNSPSILYDTLGMIVPFLVNYHIATKNDLALKIAKEQLEFYIKYGVDSKTGIPSHGINKHTKIKLGSINWGRGIGWYMLGLASLYEFDGSFEQQYSMLVESLKSNSISKGLWSQFLGVKNSSFDASATTMFLACLPIEFITKDEILNGLEQYISKKGYIESTSGDTYGFNNYSKSFGKNEMSQGLLLLALEKYK